MPDFDPYAAFGRLFTPTNDPAARAAQERRMLDAGSVLDLVRADLAAVKQCMVGGADRLRIEAHEQALREIEKRLAPAGAACDGPTVGNKIDINADANIPALGKIQMDILFAALSCDLTRVGTMQYGQTLWEATLPFLGLGTRDFHMVSHHYETDLPKCNAWLAQQLFYLLQKLAGTSEPLGGSGSMLDNTLVVWVNEFGDGDKHSGSPIPMLFAGGRNMWRTGRFRSYSSLVPVGDVLTTITHVMGTPVEKFGDPQFCNGPLRDLLS